MNNINNINSLLTKKDNAEIIRDAIARILKVEIENQKELAKSHDFSESEEMKKEDFNINVYVENARPWNLIKENENPFPLINICLQQVKKDNSPGSTINQQKYIAVFNIDCWGCGNSKDDNLPDDYLSTISAWKTARIVRNILMAGFYSYLGIRSIVRQREITSIDVIIPSGLPESAISITACRITFEVDTFQDSPQVRPAVLEEMALIVNDPTGKVNLINISNILKDSEENSEENKEEKE